MAEPSQRGLLAALAWAWASFPCSFSHGTEQSLPVPALLTPGERGFGEGQGWLEDGEHPCPPEQFSGCPLLPPARRAACAFPGSKPCALSVRLAGISAGTESWDVPRVRMERVRLLGLEHLGSWGWEGDFGPEVEAGCDPSRAGFLVPPPDTTAGVLWRCPG